MVWVTLVFILGLGCAPKHKLIVEEPMGFDSVKILKGVFQMGSPSSERGRGDLEKRHKVRLMSDFFMMRHEVQNRLWWRIMGTSNSNASASALPAVGMTWMEAIEFANKLSETSGLTPCYQLSPQFSWDFACTGWRLPTEAEWEMAARSGSRTTLFSGSNSPEVVAWFKDNAKGGAHSPCSRQENAIGLCDMSGNVEEWTWDAFGPYVTPEDEMMGGAVVDPIGASHSRSRVLRGGSFLSDKRSIRVSARKGVSPDYKSKASGLRLVRRSP